MVNYPNVLEFDILKTRSVLERVVVTFFLLTLLFGGTFSVVQCMTYFGIDSENRIVAFVLMLPVGFIFYHFEGKYDKKVRGAVVGKFIISENKIKTDDGFNLNLNFSEIKMVWVNPGMQTIDNGHREKFFFRSFETLKIKIIDNYGKEHNFHVNNHANSEELMIVSDFIEEIKKKHQFFKVHFDKQSKLSKKEYEKTLKRYSLMQSSLRRRNR